MTDAYQPVANVPVGNYNVAIDRANDAAQSERQAVGIDIGPVVGDVWTPSRVSPTNPLPVALSSSGLVTAANVAMGKIAGTSLTGSYATLLSMGGAAKQLTIISSCDQTVLVSLDSGSTNSFELDAFESISIDYACNGMQLASSTIQAKHGGTVPTVGSIRASIVR